MKKHVTGLFLGLTFIVALWHFVSAGGPPIYQPTATSLQGIVPIASGGTNSSATLNNAKTLISSGGALIESLGLQAKSAAYTVVVADHMSTINVTAPATNTTMALITLPLVASTNKGLTVTIKKADAGVAAGQQIPIACNVSDGINSSTLNVDKVISNTQVSTNTTATITTGTHNYVVGQIVTVTANTNTAVNGTWQIATVPSGTTFTYTIPSATNVNTADTGTSIAATTWLTQQHSYITLQSTGTSGNAAGQGWTVLTATDWVQAIGTGVAAFGSGTPGNTASVCLPAGEWDISGNETFNSGTVTLMSASVNTTSATLGTVGDNRADTQTGSLAVTEETLAIPSWRQSFIAAGTTVFLVGQATYSVAPTSTGRISGRRAR